MIDKRTGLTELLYGLSGSTQIRSATEADVRNQNVSVRPDDMASRVEDWLSDCAAREIIAAEWSLKAEDMQDVIGMLGASIWEQQIQQKEFERSVREFDYRIEAGSARKPNKTNKVRQLNDFAQIAMPVMQQFVQQGIDAPYNAFMRDWADANEMDVEPYIIDIAEIQAQQQEQEQQQGEEEGGEEQQMQEMQMQQQQQAQEMQMQVEQQKAQMEMQKMQLELQIKQQDLAAKQASSESVGQDQAADLELERQKMTLEVQALEIEQQKMQMELEHARAKNELEIQYMKEKNEQKDD